MKKILYPIFCILTSIVGNNIHGSIFWSIVDFFFAPIAIIKWLIYKELTMKVIESSFTWFFA